MSRSRIERVGHIDLLRFDGLDSLGVDVAVTTRGGGVSEGAYASLNLGLHVGDDLQRVVENRRRAAHTFGSRIDDMVVCNQVHGDAVAVVESGDRGRGATSMDDVVADADAMVTTQSDVVLVVLVADCVPIVLLDPVHSVLAVIHAGWPGTTKRISDATLDTMARFGSRAVDIVAGIGPAVSPATYQVGADVHAAVVAQPEIADCVRPDDVGRWRFDLPRANRLLLEARGVRPDAIFGGDRVTGLDTPFYSHRAAAPTGRFGLFARLHRA